MALNIHKRVARALEERTVVQGAGPVATTTTTTPAGGVVTVTNIVATQTVVGPPKSTTTTTALSTSSTTSSTTTSSTTTSSTPSSTTTTTALSTLSTTTTPAAFIAPTQHTTSRATLTATSAASSASTTGTSSSGSGMLIGGIGAGIFALAGLIFAIIFFVNKARRRRDGSDDFDAASFRRSAILMSDDGPRPRGGDDSNSRFNPRPPTMFERRLASSPTPPANPPQWEQFGEPQMQNYADQMAYHNQHQFVSFAPGQVIPSHAMANSPASPTSAEPLFSPSAYGPSPFSPVVDGPYPNMAQAQGPAPGTYLNRQSSTSSHHSIPNTQDAEAQYVEMSREPALPPTAHTRKGSANQLRLVHAEDLPMTPAPPYNEAERPSDFNDMKKGEPTYGNDEYDQPPSPGRTRIDSMPPKLPEVRSMSPTPFGLAMTGQTQPMALPPVPRQSLQSADIKRPDTVYDPEDAYGGI